MRRLAVLLLAGATFVVAQPNSDVSKHKMMPPDSMKFKTMPDSIKGKIIQFDTAMHKMPPCSTMHTKKFDDKDSGKAFQDKMRDAFDKARTMADSARKSAIDFHKQMMGKDTAEIKKMIAQHQDEVLAKLQKAIDGIDKALTKLSTQVDKASERAVSRLEQKKQELIKLEDRIKAKQAANQTTTK